ncbi:MAG: hypothetical protein RL637_341 [Pseudomonadota bacterium]|jgi:transcriptional regulator with XRE-family HTH domain
MSEITPKKLNEIIKKTGLKKSKVAEILDISQSYLSIVLHDRSIISKKMQRKINDNLLKYV